MKTLIASSFLIFSLVGCASPNQTPFEHDKRAIRITSTVVDQENVSVKERFSYASAVRWNNDYIVSVKHLEGNRKRCSSDTLDVAFFKSPLKKGVHLGKWKRIKNDDLVQMEGFHDGGKSFNKVFGVVKPGMFTLGGVAKYKLVTGVVKQGMSGGPVRNKDGDFVGIIVGYTAEPVELVRPSKEDLANPNQSYSVVLPYSSIKEAWDEVEQKIKEGRC